MMVHVYVEDGLEGPLVKDVRGVNEARRYAVWAAVQDALVYDVQGRLCTERGMGQSVKLAGVRPGSVVVHYTC